MKLPVKQKMWVLATDAGDVAEAYPTIVNIFGKRPLKTEHPRFIRGGCYIHTYKPVRVEVTIRPVKRGARG